jgi:ribosome-binding factor A
MLHSRDKRIEESIKKALSEAFLQELKDPRVPAIFTITRVTVSKDLSHARVYYSQLPDDDAALEQTEELLEDSAGFLRSFVAREVNLKFTPELVFHYDPSQREYQKLNTKLAELRRTGQMGEDEE